MTSVIKIASDALRVQVLTRGAALVGVRFADHPRNLVLGFADPKDHARIPCFAGHLAGPVANRVRNGRVLIDGQSYQMPLNENNETTLHSGPDGLHAQDWEIADQSRGHVTLCCTLPDGCNGLPGSRKIEAHYAVADTTLTLTITATTDKATPINIAAHPYWNLDGGTDVSGHTLLLAATHYLPTNQRNLPVGTTEPLNAKFFNFEETKVIPLDPALDLNFCLSKIMCSEPTAAAKLVGNDGTTLVIATTCPGLQVYNGAHLPALDIEMADSPPIAPYSGIALEPQHWPDAPHHSHFPQITLHPDQTYKQITQYHLSRN